VPGRPIFSSSYLVIAIRHTDSLSRPHLLPSWNALPEGTGAALAVPRGTTKPKSRQTHRACTTAEPDRAPPGDYGGSIRAPDLKHCRASASQSLIYPDAFFWFVRLGSGFFFFVWPVRFVIGFFLTSFMILAKGFPRRLTVSAASFFFWPRFFEEIDIRAGLFLMR